MIKHAVNNSPVAPKEEEEILTDTKLTK